MIIYFQKSFNQADLESNKSLMLLFIELRNCVEEILNRDGKRCINFSILFEILC